MNYTLTTILNSSISIGSRSIFYSDPSIIYAGSIKTSAIVRTLLAVLGGGGAIAGCVFVAAVIYKIAQTRSPRTVAVV